MTALSVVNDLGEKFNAGDCPCRIPDAINKASNRGQTTGVVAGGGMFWQWRLLPESVTIELQRDDITVETYEIPAMQHSSFALKDVVLSLGHGWLQSLAMRWRGMSASRKCCDGYSRSAVPMSIDMR
ncbi:MAG TPA: hypothetical protein VIS96_06000 [Terrimicrobiaceae bacterium]